MDKKNYIKIILFTVILTFGIWNCPVQSEPASPGSNNNIALDTGRTNPFGKIIQVKKLARQITQTGEPTYSTLPDLFLETITLKFLDAKNLKNAMTNMSSEYGSISADAKSNSLIICDTEENIKKILSEIRNADKTPEQIMVEVVILDVKLENDTEIGINWDLLSEGSHSTTFRQNFNTRLGWDTSGVTLFDTTGGPAGNLSIISGNIRNVLHLLQEKKDVEILASPRVMMVSGQSAYIEAVEELPYTEASDTSGGGTLTSTKFKDVGVKLQVTATITDGNNVLLSVEAEQNVQTGTSGTVPVVDTRKTQASLMLKDAQIVVMGGLRRQERTKEADQIPFLGDLPIIGGLFRSTTDIVKNSELTVFLSPHIYKGEPVPEEQLKKYHEIKNRPLLVIPKDKKTQNSDKKKKLSEEKRNKS